MTMTDQSIDDITQQARQGSVAAIIQILNDRLADDGIRTRAILAQGVLQILCEADTTERLDQENLVNRVRQILGSLRPRHIRRVKINSRLVNEQQVLWLEAIKRDPENQLLWAEEISLPRPNPIQRLVEDFASPAKPPERIVVNPSSSRKSRDRRQFTRGILGGTALSMLLLAVGWMAYDAMSQRDGFSESSEPADEQPTVASSTSEVVNTSPPSPTPNTGASDIVQGDGSSQSETPELTASVPLSEIPPSELIQSDPETDDGVPSDPFATAVLLAQQSVKDGQTAATSAEWLEIASQWQRASDLMGQIPETDERYATAQDRQTLYRTNSAEALKQAELHQAQ